MPFNDHFNAQPRWYRLFLPLSVALLAHTLIIAGIIHLLPSMNPESVEEIRFTLVKSGSDVSVKKSTPSTSARASVAEPTPATQTETPQAFEKFTIPPITTQSSSQETQRAQPDKQPDSRTQSDNASQSRATEKAAETKSSQRKPATSTNSTPSKQSISSNPSMEGERVPVQADTQAQSETPRISDSTSKDPYVAMLWEYISRELDRHPVAKLRNLDRVRVLRMELRLLQSGVTRRVDIIKSSGSPVLDAAARRSALGASPYPRPPNSAQHNGYRFQVELRFSPTRPENQVTE